MTKCVNIVLSGGWGYGNIGDDVILSSTMKIIKSCIGNVKFNVLTYDLDDSYSHLSNQCELNYCLHKRIDFNNSKYRYRTINKDFGFKSKVKTRLTKYISDSKMNSIHTKNVSTSFLSDYYKDTDIYIMCGGGYFNERWSSKMRAQLEELRVAQNLGIRTMIVGPTIGSVHDEFKRDIVDIFSKADVVTVRDESSQHTLSELGIKSKIIPDIALGVWERDDNPSSKVESIGIVFTSGKGQMSNAISTALSKVVGKKDKASVTLIITRKWKRDFQSQQDLMNDLLRLGVTSKIVLPSNHTELESEMLNCDLIVSENLHGLISAARNLIPIIAINDYEYNSPNEKKFRAFLKQTGFANLAISSDMSSDDIVSNFSQIDKDYISHVSNLKSIRRNVNGMYSHVFEEDI